jgi:DNA-binding beta-propeller fold protein YncE
MHRIKIYKIFIIAITTLMIASCSSKVSKQDLSKLVIFPAPPDTTRIQFLTSFSNSKDIVGERSSFKKAIIGQENVLEITKPYGIAVSKNRIYVCDTKLGALEIINLENKTFEYFKPTGLGEFKKPLNCFIDKDSLFYVVDVDRKDVVSFNDSLDFVKSYGFKELVKPTDVFVSGDNIYVTDIADHKIKVFSKENAELLLSFPDVDPKDTAYLHQPTNLFVTDKEIYVTDFGEFLVKVYDLKGNFIKNIGSHGSTPGNFVRPKGIALDKENNIYVVDAAFENVQIFNSNAELLLFFGGAYKGPGTMYMPAKVAIDYTNLDYFRKYVYKSFELKYLVFVTNQYGPDKVTVYGYVEPKE